MSEWKKTTLGEVANIDSGFAFKSKEYRDSGDLRVVRGKNVTVGAMRWGTDAKYWDYPTDGLERYFLSESDIVIGMDGSKIGENRSKIKKTDLPAILAQRVGRVRAKDDNSQEFLWQSINSESFVQYIKSIHTGTSIPHISQKQISDFEVLIPPLCQQKVIGSALSSLDNKIDLLHRQNKTLEQMAETLFRQWFVEEAKEDWGEKLLNEFINVKHGYAFKGTFISPDPTHLKLITPGNFKIGGGFKSDKFKYYTSTEFPESYIFQEDDLAVTMTDLSVDGDTLGAPAFIPKSKSNEYYLHNQRVGKVEFKASLSKFFLYHLMKTEDYLWFIHSSASGTSIRHTSPTSICSYPFKVPPNSLIKKFDESVKDMYRKIGNNNNQISILENLRDTLLPKLMSGEIRVEIEKEKAHV